MYLSKLVYSLNKKKACLLAFKDVKSKKNNNVKLWELKEIAVQD